ncbi:MAG: hypothetical protein QM731_07965 [Chitinophagaceae bacterium]
MKKIAFITTSLLASVAAMAQEDTKESGLSNGNIMELSRIVAVLSVVVLIAGFIIAVIKQLLEYRVKNKMIDKGVPESVVTQFLQPTEKDTKQVSIKWVTTLTGIGVALLLINATQPIGLHSLAIMAFCIAASFLAYYFYIKQTEKK